MNRNKNSNGLSARLKTIRTKFNLSLHALAKNAWVIGLVLTACMIISSCHEKSKGQELKEATKNHTTAKQDSLNKPQVNIKVNRRYDEKGNLVAVDSTYSSFYSNVRGDTSKMDSLFHSFDRYFNDNHSSFLPKEFNNLFFRDSLRYPDFFHNDFFIKRYELNDAYFRDMMHRMDSIKNHFYLDPHKTLGEHKKEKKSSSS
jgi:hypothetical protein